MNKLTIEQQLFLLTNAVAELQQHKGVYIGLCLNAAMHMGDKDPPEHPHWDEYHIKLAQKHA